MFLLNKQRRIQANVTARFSQFAAALACTRIEEQWICARMSQPIPGPTLLLVASRKNDEKLICS